MAGFEGEAFDADFFEGGGEFGGVLSDGGPSVVVDGEDGFGAEEFGGEEGMVGAHGEGVADGEAGEIDFVEFAEELHVGEEGGVAGEVDGFGFAAVFELDDPAAGLAAVGAVGEGGGVKGDGVGDGAEGEGFGAAVVHIDDVWGALFFEVGGDFVVGGDGGVGAFGDGEGVFGVVKVGVADEDVGGVGGVGFDIGEGVGGVEGVELDSEVGEVDFDVGVAVVEDFDGHGSSFCHPGDLWGEG